MPSEPEGKIVVPEFDDRWDELLYKAADGQWDSRFFDQNGPHAGAPGFRALCAAILTTTKKVESWEQVWRPEDDDPLFIDRLPRWPATLEPIDRVYAGFFGLTSLVSQPGIGKTMLGLASALQAAGTQRWNVKYFGAEVDDDEIQERRAREFKRHPSARNGVDYFEFRHVGLGQSMRDMVFDLLRIDPSLPILVVWDSINTIAKMMGGPYLDRLNELCMWAAFARKLSRGAISFLIISETNKNGRSKGESLEFWSDLCLYMKGKPDETAVNFHIEKVRRGQWTNIEMMTRYWPMNRFYTQSELMQLQSSRVRGQIPAGPVESPYVDDGDELDLF